MTYINKSILITGSSGFVGKNLIKNLNHYNYTIFKRNVPFNIKEKILINLAGKAHDLNFVSDPSSYYEANTYFVKYIFDEFLNSQAEVFITLSSVKAVADEVSSFLTEDDIPNPITHYGKSKLLAEQYILDKEIPKGKRVYILRPCMIHGPGNKGNLNLLYKFVKKNYPWPLGAYKNQRSFCSIENLCFVIDELIKNDRIPSGIYNIADDEPISTNELLNLIANTKKFNIKIWNIPKNIISIIVAICDFFKLGLNSERIKKLTESYVVSNKKISVAMKKKLPVSTKDGLIKTILSFE
jgi:nucleoside-diphosphate-sugar epimerase